MNTKLKPIPELDALPEDQQEQLHKWIEDLGYRKAMSKLQEDCGISITYNKIYRYFQRVLQKRQYEEHLEHKIALPEYLALLNGEPVPYDQAGIQTIHKRAFELACAPRITASTLATLLRVFHYKTALALTERREARADLRILQNDRRNDIAERRQSQRSRTRRTPRHPRRQKHSPQKQTRRPRPPHSPSRRHPRPRRKKIRLPRERRHPAGQPARCPAFSRFPIRVIRAIRGQLPN